jgi:2-isopropylmalate synthase
MSASGDGGVVAGSSGGDPGDRVYIFDTTLRDGEQSPGFALDGDAKLEVARQLERLGVDVIEAGFPISSPGDFAACRRIAREVREPMVTALARAVRPDIDAVWAAIQDAERPQIHIVLSVSDIHIQRKLGKTRQQVLEIGEEAVTYARGLCDAVEYSPEDAGRADRDYLVETVERMIDAGATTINIPDTTGYCLPEEFGGLIRYVIANVRHPERAIISVHCHDDLGLATANTMAAIKAGARRAEVTINGIGERAGNTALEEVVMLLQVRQAALGLECGVDTGQIVPASELLTRLTGVHVQPNKAIVGANAFAHASGIHQDGVLKDASNYEIMRPEDVGLDTNRIVLTARSGRHAFRHRLHTLGITVPDDRFEEVWTGFLQIADTKKEVTDDDLRALTPMRATCLSGERQQADPGPPGGRHQPQIERGQRDLPPAGAQ